MLKVFRTTASVKTCVVAGAALSEEFCEGIYYFSCCDLPGQRTTAVGSFVGIVVEGDGGVGTGREEGGSGGYGGGEEVEGVEEEESVED